MTDLPADFLASPREPKVVTHEFERWLRKEWQESAKSHRESEMGRKSTDHADIDWIEQSAYNEGFMEALGAVAERLGVDI
tara:strand:- start:61 stop:300 length:240 start_codon:yes stop_codon:yes gene_type:complete